MHEAGCPAVDRMQREAEYVANHSLVRVVWPLETRGGHPQVLIYLIQSNMAKVDCGTRCYNVCCSGWKLGG